MSVDDSSFISNAQKSTDQQFNEQEFNYYQ
jgi:hypothetical protein